MPTSPIRPPVSMTVAEIAEELNLAERLARRPEKWDRWNTRSFCEGMGIDFVQRGEKSKLYATGAQLDSTGLWLNFVQVRERAEREAKEAARVVGASQIAA